MISTNDQGNVMRNLAVLNSARVILADQSDNQVIKVIRKTAEELSLQPPGCQSRRP